MGGDYTRLTFRPREHHSGVLMQQGRVQLDADWNEQVELLDRRLRAETLDIIGRATVPAETPDGFRIEAAGGTLAIGRGRIYVDGLLAENHGAEPLELDPALAELRGTQPVTYETQPYFPNAAAAAPLPEAGTHLAYLDVWQREVTYLEEPDLVEKAIGVDTAARLQTVWQVRLLENVGDNATCTGEIEGWAELTAPSAGRLTTSAVGVPAPDDPCIVPPAGGYRGTENRLYRVEIHDRGPLGTATFKWSRDNASVASPVTGIDAAATELTVSSIGRDSVRRFNTDDWVEVTDDWRELHGLPGELRKVQAVDEARRTLTLAAALPAGAFDAADPARHTRVRRWDQAGPEADANAGVLAVPASGAILLEDGVQIEFGDDPDGGDLRTGDYWVFAARTADASVEELVAEPPRGIHHHYARLAVVTFPEGATDCRVLWPPDFGGESCDCTVCVSPESHASGRLTIQQAIDRVKDEGGKICLGPGIYRLDEGLRVSGARSVLLQGRGWRTVLAARGTAPAIAVESSIGVRIEDLTVVTSSVGRVERAERGGTAVAIRNSIGTTVERCLLVQSGFLRGGAALFGKGGASFRAALDENRAGGGPLVGLDGLVVQTLVRENVVVGTAGLAPLLTRRTNSLRAARSMDSAAASERGRTAFLLTFNLTVADNVLLCDRTGIGLEGFSGHMGDTRIAGNSLFGCSRGGIVCSGVTAPAARIDVEQNILRVSGDAIFVGTDDTRVVGNDVGAPNEERRQPAPGAAASRQPAPGAAPAASAPREQAPAQAGDGIVLGPSLRPTGIDRALVLGNRVTGIPGDGIAIRAPVVSALVKQNVIEGVGGGGIVMEAAAFADTLAIENNQLLRIAPEADDAELRVAGIRVVKTREAVVAGNTVAGVGRSAVRSASRVGIELGAVVSARVSGNEVVDVGPAGEYANGAAGIAVLGEFERLDVVDNSVRRSRERPDDAGRSDWFALLVRALPEPGNVGVVALARSDNASYSFSENRVVAFPRGRGFLGVRGNLLETYGSAPAAQVVGDVACTFSDNRCLLTSQGRLSAAQVGGRAVIAGGNLLEAPEESPALEILVLANGPFTVLGNIASGPIEVNGSALGAPWAQLNVS